MTDIIINRISELKSKVNRDWATVIGHRMHKNPRTIRAYAMGTRGVSSGYHLIVLKHLTDLDKQKSEQINKLLNS